MSLIASITKKSKLKATIEQTAQARKSEGSTADSLFKAAYKGYAEVLQDDPLRAETLYNWGFALLHQAKTKTGDEAARIYQDAIDKFAFCMLINPDYLGAPINGGVAYMDLARLKKVKPDHELYELAKKQFEKANTIQAGTASYNLACIYGLRGDRDACLKALENARDKVTLPEAGEILNDPDLVDVKEQDWFVAFMESLSKKAEADSENKEAVAEKAHEKKWVLVERNAVSEEIITEQDASVEDNSAETEAK
jgi:tetratricopeptide (TPR) repeat protein